MRSRSEACLSVGARLGLAWLAVLGVVAAQAAPTAGKSDVRRPARVEIHHRHGVVATHPRLISQRDARSTDAAHHPTPARASRTPAIEAQLRHDSPELEAYVRALKQRGQGRGARALRRLLELQRTYPGEPFLAAVRQAAHYGLYDLGRLEKLILQQVAGNFFALNDGLDDDA